MKNKHFAKMFAVMIAMILTINGGFALAEENTSTEPPVVQEAPTPVQQSEAAPVVNEPVAETTVETPAPVATESTTIQEPTMAEPETAQTVETGTDETQQNEQPAAEESSEETHTEEPQETEPEEEEAAETSDEQNQTQTDDQTDTSSDDEKQTATDESKETKEPDKETPFSGTASVVKITLGKLYVGNTAILKARVSGANKHYTIRWQTRKGGSWKTIVDNTKYTVNGKVLSVKLDKTDNGREYRVVLLVTEENKINQYNSGSFVFGGVTDKPKDEDAEKVEETTTEEEIEEAAETDEEKDEEGEFYEENDAQTEEGYTDGDDEYEDETEEAVEESFEEHNKKENEIGTTDQMDEQKSGDDTQTDETEDKTDNVGEDLKELKICAEWKDGEAKIGNDITFYVTLDGYEDSTVRVQWQHSTDNVAWEDIPGAFEKNYTVTATEYNCKDFWRAKVTSVSNE